MKRKLIFLLILITIVACGNKKNTPTGPIESHYEATDSITKDTQTVYLFRNPTNNRIEQLRIELQNGTIIKYNVEYTNEIASKLSGTYTDDKGYTENIEINDSKEVRYILFLAENKVYIPSLYEDHYRASEGNSDEIVFIYRNTALNRIEKLRIEMFSGTIIEYTVEYTQGEATKLNYIYKRRDGYRTDSTIDDKIEINNIINNANKKAYIAPLNKNIYIANHNTISETIYIYRNSVNNKIENIRIISTSNTSLEENIFNIEYNGFDATKLTGTYTKGSIKNNISINDDIEIKALLLLAEYKEFIPFLNESPASLNRSDYFVNYLNKYERVYIYRNPQYSNRIERIIIRGSNINDHYESMLDIMYNAGNEPINLEINFLYNGNKRSSIISDTNEIKNIITTVEEKKYTNITRFNTGITTISYSADSNFVYLLRNTYNMNRIEQIEETLRAEDITVPDTNYTFYLIYEASEPVKIILKRRIVQTERYFQIEEPMQIQSIIKDAENRQSIIPNIEGLEEHTLVSYENTLASTKQMINSYKNSNNLVKDITIKQVKNDSFSLFESIIEYVGHQPIKIKIDFIDENLNFKHIILEDIIQINEIIDAATENRFIEYFDNL